MENSYKEIIWEVNVSLNIDYVTKLLVESYNRNWVIKVHYLPFHIFIVIFKNFLTLVLRNIFKVILD